MNFKRWKNLTEQEKEKRLKRIWTVTSGIFILIILLLLMKCEGCSSDTPRKNRDFTDGRGHSYGEQLSGSSLFVNGYENGADYSSELSNGLSSNQLSLEEKERLEAEEKAELKAEEEKKIKTDEDKKLKADEEKKLKAAEEKKIKAEEEKKRKAEEDKKRKLEEEKKRKAEEDKKRKLEEEKKRKAEENKKLKAAEEKNRKAEEEKAKKLDEENKKKAEIENAKNAEEAKRKADEEKRKNEEANRLKNQAEEEKRLKQEAEDAAKKSVESARKEEEQKVQEDFIVSKLDQIAKKLEEATSEKEKQKLLEEGVELTEQLSRIGGESASAHYILSQEAQKKKKYLDAMSELQKAIALNEFNYLYHYDLGKIEYLLKRYSDALASFERSCELNNSFSPSIYNMGLTYVKLGDENLALSAFKKSVKINPEYEKGYIEQARVYNRQGKLSECVQAYDELIKRFPDNNAAMMELGSVYYQYGKYKESEAQYQKVLEKLSKSEERTLTAYNLSKVLYDDNKYNEALHYGWMAYDERDFLINDVQQANIIYNYALIQEKNGKSEEAKKLYQEALQKNPSHLKSKINLSVLYMDDENENVDKVIALLLEAYKSDAKDFSVNNNLGTAYILKEDYASAEKYYKAALEIKKDDEDALLNLANALAKGNKLSEATAAYSKLTSKNPENLEAFVGLAKVQIQSGDSQTAYKNLLYVKKKNPDFRKTEVDSLLAVLVD